MHYIFIIIFFISKICFANEDLKQIYKDGLWEGIKDSSMQVKVDTTTNGVTVTLNKNKYQMQKSITFSFFDLSGKKNSIKLTALDPLLDPSMFLIHYTGRLNEQQSFISFEIQIPLGSTKSQIIRSSELKKLEANNLFFQH